MFYSDDPVQDFNRHDAHQERLRARLPVCENRSCHKVISDEDYYDIHGELLCEECMKVKYGRKTADLVNAYE